MKTNKRLFTILGALLLFLASTGVTYAAFRFSHLTGNAGPLSSTEISSGRDQIDLSAPKTAACPLNGGMFTEAERAIWEARRPMAVMIENHTDARPQSGLASADVVYEAVAEGGITRFLAVFYCGAAAADVLAAPIRSARVYFVNFASEYGAAPVFVHVGGANGFGENSDTPSRARAVELLEAIGWRFRGGNDFDTTFDMGFPAMWRDYERLGRPAATEHTYVGSTDKLWAEAQQRGFGAEHDGEVWSDAFVAWPFKDDASTNDRGGTNSIKFNFWSGYQDFVVNWQYDQAKNNYLRSTGGQFHQDLNNDQQLIAKTVVVQLVREEGPLDHNKHMFYTVIGKGQALIFQDGQVTKGTWQKTDRQSRTKFLDSRGQPIEFNRGPIWIEVVPATQEVEY